ncbi:MAG TPA: ABC transporter ATP-binding protein [Thermohalobaculum sp.]|nr:ABC transporter ATP-binding protein [Thermohalobaculum sp.]
MDRIPLLSVEELSIGFALPGMARPVVDGLSFSVAEAETVAIVGESGSGKTLTGKALMGLLPKAASCRGRALFRHDGREIDLLHQSRERHRDLRGRSLSMIFQEPMSALSPLHRIGEQVAEVLRVHRIDGNVRARVIEIFGEVGFPDPERAWRAYPFELSGGLRQRAIIAMAMVANPALVIADEPTTALDVTTQAQVLGLLERLQGSHRMSVILITHDLGIVANMADRVVVLKRGRLVESGSTRDVLGAPGHAYTRRLMAAAPKVSERPGAGAAVGHDLIMRVENLSKTYPGRPRLFGRPDAPVAALSGLDMVLERGRTLALVGESGSGKTTVARVILRSERPDPGATIAFHGRDGAHEDVTALSGPTLKAFRRRAQMVFQDPYGALSPRMSVQDILTEPLRIHGIGTPAERRERAAYLLRRVGLSPEHLGRFPYAFSGGQRQRIAIARALALEPELLVLDEPTSALDVSVQAEVLELLRELHAELGLTYLFISHDLAVVAEVADRVMVMRRGRVLEEGAAGAVFSDPRHPYTQALIAAHPEPVLDRRLDLAAVARGAGEPETWPEPFRYEGDAAPGLVEVSPGHRVRQNHLRKAA